MWEPCWGAIPSIQGSKVRLLLADHESELHGVCAQVQQVSVVFVDIESPPKGAHIYDPSVALRFLGN